MSLSFLLCFVSSLLVKRILDYEGFCTAHFEVSQRRLIFIAADDFLDVRYENSALKNVLFSLANVTVISPFSSLEVQQVLHSLKLSFG
jgi:hypothetical protein